MIYYPDTLKKEERVALALRSIYENLGYRKYNMSRFEEYSFYMEYKNFLPCEQIISFTDLDGKLLALKPDVTLSIVKNAKALKGSFEKLYYVENVYKPAKNAHKFQENSQIGLEAMGPIDDYTTLEVIRLALKSLEAVEDDFVLDISHIGIVAGLLEVNEPDDLKREKILECIASKNLDDLQRLCGDNEDMYQRLSKLVTIGGTLKEALPQIAAIVANEQMQAAYNELQGLCKALDAGAYESKVKVDFSIISDVDYYSGIIFQGYVRRVPRMILSGGRYDKLLAKLGKGVGAIGFALSLNELAGYYPEDNAPDTDVVVLYDKDADPKALLDAIEDLTRQGLKVKAETSLPADIKYNTLYKFCNGRLEESDV